MSSLNEIIRNIVVIVLLATFLDMLLPNTNLRRFIKVIMGLFIMVTILNPIINIFNQEATISAWDFNLQENEDVDSILEKGKKISSDQNAEAAIEYKKRIEKQIEAMVHLIPEVDRVNCTAELASTEDLKNMGQIEKVFLEIYLGTSKTKDQDQLVDPVKIDLGQSQEKEGKKEEVNKSAIKSKVINLVSNYYSISEEDIDLSLIYEEEN